MKKILCLIFALGVCVFSFAGKENEKQLSKAEFMSQVGADLIKASTIIPEMEKEMKGLQEKNNECQQQISILTAEKQMVAKLFASVEGTTMLIQYPLSVQYDSALVALSQKIIKYYGIAEDKANKDYCELMLPYLSGYKEYNNEIYNLIARIQTIYFGPLIKKVYPEDQFEKDIQKTNYFKHCSKDGVEGIPYLSEIIRRVQELAQSKKLTREVLQEMLDKLK